MTADFAAASRGRAEADGCEFGHALANHLPMVLVALRRLGADAARLETFAAAYRGANALGPPPPRRAPITPSNWTRCLGERAREADYRDFFAAEAARLGAAAMQRAYLPVLLPGVAASALHALMRLAYAHLEDRPAEMATALGYWAATYLALPAGGAGHATGDDPGCDAAGCDDPGAVLDGLRDLTHLVRIEPETDLLWHAMRAVGADPAFSARLDGLRVGADALPRFAAAALALFAGAPDFCSLHALTALHWARLIPEALADRPTLLRHLWRALAAVYPKMGMPALPSAAALAEWRARDCPPWAAIAAAAIASDDEHDISLVFSAREEAAAWGDRLYQVVAARRVGLIA